MRYDELRSLQTQLSDLQTRVDTLERGGKTEYTHAMSHRDPVDLSVKGWSIVKRQVVDRDHVLISKAEFDELRMKVETFAKLPETVIGLTNVVTAVNRKTESADRIAFDCLNALANVCAAIGIDLRVNADGNVEVTGIAAEAPEKLSLYREVLRHR